MSKDLDKDLKKAFHLVRKTFCEFGSLMLDFEAELQTANNNIIPDHSDKGFVTEPSRSLQFGDRWLHPYIARYYIKSDVQNFHWYAAAGMIHKDKNHQPIEPLFLMGVIGVLNPNKKYEPWWLSGLYTSDIDRYVGSELKVEDDIVKDDWTYVELIKEVNSWYDVGYVYPKKLSSIRSRDDVHDLAFELAGKFKNHAGSIPELQKRS